MPMKFLFLVLGISLIFNGNFMSLKFNSSPNNLLAFLILAGWSSAGFKDLTKYHLKHSFSSILWILIKPFLDGLILLVIWCKCYSQGVVLWKNNSVIGDWINNPACIFDVIVLWIDSNRLSLFSFTNNLFRFWGQIENASFCWIIILFF